MKWQIHYLKPALPIPDGNPRRDDYEAGPVVEAGSSTQAYEAAQVEPGIRRMLSSGDLLEAPGGDLRMISPWGFLASVYWKSQPSSES